jgi:GT2 family glycosyltransferase
METLSQIAPALPWTGERMIPFEADPVTEFFHWQRYLFFKPWYAGAEVIDAASGEGYGLGFAAKFAANAKGFDVSREAVRHATQKYPNASFEVLDVCEADYSAADLVLSFETIEHLADPERFLSRLSNCSGRIVISTPNRLNHSPGNRLTDRPLNKFHNVEWTPSEFEALIHVHFGGRQIRMLSQEDRFPGLIREGLDDSAKYAIAVIGEGDLPQWPRLGISMPTCNGTQRTQDAIYNFCRFYPGEIEFAVVANGSTSATVAHLEDLEKTWPHIVQLVKSPVNLGYGKGANLGLDLLSKTGGFDLFGVSNDDVIASIQCLTSLVCSLESLKSDGLNPGMIGPASNSVNGSQWVDIGTFSSYREMMERAEIFSLNFQAMPTQAIQVRGLFFLTTPECLATVGGFDPIFGLGNFEDDDWNVRARLAGFSLWVDKGAFLYHAGSSTFNDLGLDYAQNIDRNLKLFLEKWASESHGQAMERANIPPNVVLYRSLDADAPYSGFSMRIGCEEVDLVHQATETEFAAAVMLAARSHSRDVRAEILNILRFPTSSERAA